MSLAEGWAKIGRIFTSSLSDLNPFRAEEPYLSIDIGSGTIKILEVRGPLGQPRITNAARVPTPPGAIRSNQIADPGAVAEVLRRVVEGRKLEARKVCTAVPGPAVIIKRMSVPTQ